MVDKNLKRLLEGKIIDFTSPIRNYFLAVYKKEEELPLYFFKLEMFYSEQVEVPRLFITLTSKEMLDPLKTTLVLDNSISEGGKIDITKDVLNFSPNIHGILHEYFVTKLQILLQEQNINDFHIYYNEF